MNKTKLIAIVNLMVGISFSGMAFGMGDSPKKSRRRPEQPSKILIQTSRGMFRRTNKHVEELKGSFRIVPIRMSKNETTRFVEFKKYYELEEE